MKKKLPVKQPIINTYTSYGAIFSIIPYSAWPWVMNNFIQLNYVYAWDMPTFGNHRMLMSNCPAINFYERPGSMVYKKESDFMNIIVDGINQDYYLFIYIDRFYIKVADEYQKEHFPHEIFIYGYDLELEEVYVADNLQHGKFIFTICTFSELTSGYNNMTPDIDFFYTIRYLSIHENTICSLNVNQIISGLVAYLYCFETFDIVGSISKMDYGIAVIDNALQQITNSSGKKIDIRFFHLFYEHKLLMEARVKTLIENNYIKNNEINIEEFAKLKWDAISLRNLVIKYNVLLKDELRIRIYNKLTLMKKKDIEHLSYLIWLLRRERG